MNQDTRKKPLTRCTDARKQMVITSAEEPPPADGAGIPCKRAFHAEIVHAEAGETGSTTFPIAL